MEEFKALPQRFDPHLLSHAELPVFPFPLRLAEALKGVKSVLVLALVSPLHRHLCVLFSPEVEMIGNGKASQMAIIPSGGNLRES